jgi:hypothetical protein
MNSQSQTKIPDPAREVYVEISNEVVWLHARWIVYRQLFATSERRIDLLNQAAASVFYVVQTTLISDTIITLCKLTDGAQTGKHHNLTLAQLLNRLRPIAPARLVHGLEGMLSDIDQRCAPFRLHRNKQLAHFDLSTALASTANMLPGITNEMIESAMQQIAAFLNRIQGHYDDTDTGYDHFIMHGTDGDALAHVIKEGLRYEELANENVISYDDIDKGEWADC